MNIKSKNLKIIYYVASYFLIAIEFVIFCIFINHNIDNLINSDNSSELILSKLMSENNQILIDDWYYSSELRIFYSNLIFAILFKFINNWHTVRVIGTIIINVITLLCLYLFMKAIKKQNLFPIIGIIFLLPFNFYYVYYIMIGQFYSFNFILELLIISTLLMSSKNENKTLKIIIFIVCCILSFIAGLCGLRLIVNLFLPLALTIFILFLIKRKTDKKDYYKKLLLSVFIICIFAAVGCLIYNLLCNIYEVYKFGYTDSIKLTFRPQVIVNSIYNLFVALIPNQSLNPIYWIFTIFYCFLFLICCAITFSKKYNSSEEDKILAVFVICAFIVLTAIYVFTLIDVNTQYIYLSWIFSLFVIISGLKNFINNNHKIFKMVLASMSLVLFLGFSVSAYPVYWNRNDNIQKIEIANKIVESKVTYGYASFWNANILTELSNGQIKVSFIDKINNDEWKLDNHWLIQKSLLELKPNGKVFLLLSKDEFNDIKNMNSENSNYLEYTTESFYLFIYDNYGQMIELSGIDFVDAKL